MKNTVYLITAAAMAVIPVTTYGWVRSYGFEGVDAGLQVQQVSDGYLVFANAHLEELSDMWLLKTDPEGDTVWTHLFGMGGHEWGIAAFITSEKDFLIFSGNNYPGIMIMCTDSTGQVLWSRDYLDRLLTSAYPTSDGGYILGQSYGLDGQCSVMKVDDHGDSLWHRVYEYEDTRDAVETLDKGYVITGGRGRDGTVWLIKADSSGKSLWSRTYTDWEASYGNCVRPTSDGGYILAGSCTVDQTGRLLVIKTDSEGNMLWSHAADYESVAKCVHETEDGFLVAGRDSDAYKGLLLKLNDSGEEVWTQRYGSRTDFNWFEETADGGFILTGDKWLGVENYDVYIVKTDEEGNAVVAEKVDYDPLDWVLTSKIGREIVLRYSNHPQGFHASVFDASGRKVDELHSPQSSGTITWGEGYGQGVYFIISDVEGWGRAQKAVLVK